MPGSLLAKSKSGPVVPPEISLTGHTACVLRAADALFGREDSPTKLGRSWLQFFGLRAADFGRFRRHLRVAAAAHDWGKANDGFQDAVREGAEQVVRHEHLSGLLLAEILSDPRVLAWSRGEGIDEVVLLAAVISHHVKVGQKGERALGALVGKREALRFYYDHDDYKQIWKMIQGEVGPPCETPIRFPTRWKKADIAEKAGALRALLDKEKSKLREDRVRRRWIAAVRAALIVADAVGSAVVRIDREGPEDAGKAIDRWVGECFSKALSGEEIWEKVIEQRIAELRKQKRWDDAKGHTFGGVGGFKKFQCEVAAAGPRVLVTEACGSGKTLAAWNWIKTQLEARPPDRPLSRVLFLYPTRATATEGFRDYVSWAPEDEAGLLSGTAAYELRDMFETPPDPADFRKGLKYRSDPRLFALGHWKKRIFSATADQFFPFMQYQYGPLCLLPLLAEAVLVVDEVHSFDRSMFSTLKRFLKEFPEIPVLCMTATLPEVRRNDLVACGLKPYPESAAAGPDDDASYPRYHVEWIDRAAVEKMARNGLEVHNSRVLWVSNRVADCQAVFESFREDGYIGPGAVSAYCYHSRFKLEDRKERHKDLIQAFQDAVKVGAERRGLLGATTQVCEMSLDLDAEILVTELAPMASLIQRMGRCNRDSKKMRHRPIGRVYVIRPESGKEKPYEKEELDAAKEFVEKVAGRDLSQIALDEAYQLSDLREIEPEKVCPFLDSGPYAEARVESFREIDEFTTPCILDYDVPKVLEMLHERGPAARGPIDGMVVPVPRRFATETRPNDPRFPRWLSVASGTRYDSSIGFDDRERNQDGGRQP